MLLMETNKDYMQIWKIKKLKSLENFEDAEEVI